ncbi:uncharacterized protein LOC135484804 [Lineus longissimus]|uniref:uncharacterized protein LOC135484804 n=1 Tax=Lineus longissimus TaxID=88925 RepID=UPI00315DDF8E
MATAMPYQVQPPEKFNFKPDDWPKWKRRFNRFREASGLSTKSQENQVNTLIYCMGDEADDILNSITLTDDDRRSYDVIVEKLESYFLPKRNVIFERAKFNQRRQSETESVDQFITDLFSLAEHCQFGNLKDELIRDRIVVGIKDTKLAEKMQLNSNLTLTKAMTMVRQCESVKAQQTVLRGTELGSTAEVAKVGGSDKPTSSKGGHKKPGWVKQHQRKGNPGGRTKSQWKNKDGKCHRCGKTPSHSKQNCPAKDAECHKCKFTGHYQKMCKNSKTVSEIQEEGIFLGAVNSKLHNGWVSAVKLGSTKVNWKIDTGAEVSCIPYGIYTRNKASLGKLHQPDRKLFGAGGNELQVKGVILTRLQKRDVKVDSVVYVVDGLKNPLLGQPAIRALKLVSVVESVDSESADIKNIKAKYPKLFSGLGKLKGDYTIKLKDGAEPYAISAARRIAIPLLTRTKTELERMANIGVVSEVREPTDWCAGMVVVPKSNGSVRICVDLTKLNESVCRERHQMPSVDYTLAQLKGAKVFSKLDANSGFWQIPLDPESRKLTTFMTPWGRYCFNRLPYGISSGPELFQKRMQEILEGLDGVLVEIDDILVYGMDQQEHDRRLHAVLNRLMESGVTLNGPKCEISKEKLLYLAHILDSEGIRPDPRKIKAVQDFPEPNNVPELRRFLGMITYLGRFIPNLASKTEPLRCLMSKKNSWVWEGPQKGAFASLKAELISPPLLAHYDPEKETIVSADASSYGLGGVILQVHEKGVKRPVAYASRTLNDTEKRYAQIEKEALAATWACERFSDYVLGKTFSLETDHKPLVPLLGGGKSLEMLPARVQRFKMRLMKYSYQIKHVPGKELYIADALSRAPLQRERSEAVITHLKNMFARHGIPERLRSDNGPQYDSQDFRCFANKFEFEHVTSSPLYPQGNGEAERAVQTVKNLIKKSKDFTLALLAYRSTPLQNGYSPSELLMGRRLRNTLPQHHSKLEPKWSYGDLRKKEEEYRRKMTLNADKHHAARSLPQLGIGDTVWIPDKEVTGSISGHAETPRSYVVTTPKGTFRRNRRSLCQLAPSLNTDQDSQVAPDISDHSSVSNGESGTVAVETSQNDTSNSAGQSTPRPPVVTTRSGRISKPAVRLDL